MHTHVANAQRTQSKKQPGRKRESELSENGGFSARRVRSGASLVPMRPYPCEATPACLSLSPHPPILSLRMLPAAPRHRAKHTRGGPLLAAGGTGNGRPSLMRSCAPLRLLYTRHSPRGRVIGAIGVGSPTSCWPEAREVLTKPQPRPAECASHPAIHSCYRVAAGGGSGSAEADALSRMTAGACVWSMTPGAVGGAPIRHGSISKVALCFWNGL